MRVFDVTVSFAAVVACLSIRLFVGVARRCVLHGVVCCLLCVG